MVQRTILRLSLPGGKPRPKPGPYEGGNGAGAVSIEALLERAEARRSRGENGSGPEQPQSGVRVKVPARDEQNGS
jgi:linoleoyl-CoA desaturase